MIEALKEVEEIKAYSKCVVDVVVLLPGVFGYGGGGGGGTLGRGVRGAASCAVRVRPRLHYRY